MKVAAMMLGGALAAAVLPAQAKGEWETELTPYIWAQSIAGDITVQDRTASVEIKFEDLFDALDVALGGLMVARKDDWVYWLQLDYADLSTDNLDNPPQRATLDTTMFLASGAIGKTYPFFVKDSSIDVLLGARYLHLKNEITPDNPAFPGRESSSNVVDPTILVRPSVPLFSQTFKGRLRFNPTIGLGGGGDSEFVYELQPQVQYMWDSTAIRFGYRKLHYKIDGDRGEFDGGLEGLLLGFGWTL